MEIIISALGWFVDFVSESVLAAVVIELCFRNPVNLVVVSLKGWFSQLKNSLWKIFHRVFRRQSPLKIVGTLTIVVICKEDQLLAVYLVCLLVEIDK